MRKATAALFGAFALAATAVSADAAPLAPAPLPQDDPNLIQVAGGCGRGFYPNRWGRCVPMRYGYARPRPQYYGYYRPRYWTPSDNVANQLNHHELGRIYSGGGGYYRGPGWGY